MSPHVSCARMLRELRLRRPLDRSSAIESVLQDHPDLAWRALSTAITPGRQTSVIRAEGSKRALAALRARYIERPPPEQEVVSVIREGAGFVEWLDVERSGVAATDISGLVYESFRGDVAIELSESAEGRAWRFLTFREDAIPGFVTRLKEAEAAVERLRERAIPRYDVRALARPRAGAADPGEELTPREESVLALAVRLGFYESPKRASIQEIADRLDMPASTAHRYLKRAESKVLRERILRSSASVS